MKYFFLGLTVFLIYCSLCLLGLHYFLKNEGTTVSLDNTSSVSILPDNINAGLLKKDTIKVLTFEDYMPSVKIDTAINRVESSSDTTNILEPVVESTSMTKADSTLIVDIEDKENISAIKDKPTVIDTLRETEEKTALITYKPRLFGIYDDRGNTLVTCKTYSRITKNKALIQIPNSCKRYGLVLKDMLELDPKLSILITTAYGNDEEESIGIARAEYMISQLTKSGISKKRILFTVQPQNISFNNDTARGGLHVVVANSYNLSEKLNKLSNN